MKTWSLCLNTSTIKPAPLLEKIAIAAKAGYQAIELWNDDVNEFQAVGGSLTDLRRRLDDSGLKVPSMIALFYWMNDEGIEKAREFPEVKRRMEQAAALGASHIVASPYPDLAPLDIGRAAARYRELLELGATIGITPAMEFLGFQRNVYQLEQAVAIAEQSDHPQACIVLDPFHLYRGGSGFGGIRALKSVKISICHFNDSPASPSQFQQTDGDRVYPGDGILPLKQMLRDLDSIDYRGYLSVELFNESYWQRDLNDVARTAREKTMNLLRSAS